MTQIRIVRGQYLNQPVSGVFQLIRPYRDGARGGYVTVENDGSLPGGTNVRVKVARSSDFEYLESTVGRSAPANVTSFIPLMISSGPAKPESQPAESDEDAMNRIQTRFAILDEMSQACIGGDIRAMIVSGPPGVGKSYGVEAQLEKQSLFDKIAGKKIRFEIVKGAMTALGLYAQLYKFSDPKNVLVFDDCDSVLMDDLALNILKAALDSGKRRRIFWNSDSNMLRREGIPDNFEFRGSVIFITNLSFESVRSKKLQDHLDALQSRCHYLDLTINSERDKMLRIRQVHRDADGGLFRDYDFDDAKAEEVLGFMWENRTRLREVSLRMALKVADLVKISPTNWRVLTENTCMRAV
jgi:hypothetical protein